jgi:uncharacterized protein YqfB (UPF0267 family)
MSAHNNLTMIPLHLLQVIVLLTNLLNKANLFRREVVIKYLKHIVQDIFPEEEAFFDIVICLVRT